MTNIFIYILISSAMCSLCGLLVLLLNSLVKGVSQRFRCSILMLAVILPYVGVFTTPLFSEVKIASETNIISVEDKYTEVKFISYFAEELSESVMDLDGEDHNMIAVIAMVVEWVWFTIAVGIIIYGIIRHIRLMNILCGERQKIDTKGKLSIYTVNINISPFLTGFFKPKIYIPADTYNNEELELVIAHEVAHYMRGDLYKRILIAFIRCVNWFNPIYCYILKKLISQIEFACDEEVINRMGKGTNKIYGYMLLKTAENGIKNEYLTVGLGSNGKNLKRRINYIMSADKKLTKRTKLIACTAFTLSAILSTGGCGAAIAIVNPLASSEDNGRKHIEQVDDRGKFKYEIYNSNGDMIENGYSPQQKPADGYVYIEDFSKKVSTEIIPYNNMSPSDDNCWIPTEKGLYAPYLNQYDSVYSFSEVAFSNGQTLILGESETNTFHFSANQKVLISVMLDFSPDYIIDDDSGSCIRLGYIHNNKAVILYGKSGTDKIGNEGLKTQVTVPDKGEYTFFLTNFCGGLANISECKIEVQ